MGATVSAGLGLQVVNGRGFSNQQAGENPTALATAIPVMLSIKEVAEKYRLPVHFVREAVRQKLVYSVQAGSRKIYINEASVVRWLSGGAQDGC